MNFFWNERKHKYKKTSKITPYRKKPKIYSNLPVHFKPHFWTKKNKKEWNYILRPKHVYLLKPIIEYSVVLIDEFPQFINQFMYDDPLVQDNCNEFFTFYRQYYGGHLITTAQASSDMVVQFRRKINRATWCYDFKKHLFGLFYTNKMIDVMLSEDVNTVVNAQLDEDVKTHWGLFPPRGTYSSRAYKPRVEEALETTLHEETPTELTTKTILRAKFYESPLDMQTTKEQKQRMLRRAKKLERQ